MKGTCTICGEVIEGRRGSVRSARANFLNKLRKHQWKKHPNTMRKRIKDGKKRANEINPSIQDFISALQDAPARASRIYKEFKARDYIQLKGVMDALEPFLPEKVKITWKIIDSIHSGLE